MSNISVEFLENISTRFNPPVLPEGLCLEIADTLTEDIEDERLLQVCLAGSRYNIGPFSIITLLQHDDEMMATRRINPDNIQRLNELLDKHKVRIMERANAYLPR